MSSSAQPISLEEKKALSFSMLPWVLPFAAYMGFIGVGSFLSWMGESVPWDPETMTLWMYPVKIIVVGGLLIWLWGHYEELKGRIVLDSKEALLSVGMGLLVYLLWIRMDWSWAVQGEVTGYDPFQAGPVAGLILAGSRLFGASVVVPIMEELFWRSFLIRYVINSRFETVPLGTFTVGSCFLTVVLFGLEHNLWLAGMMAGIAYNLILYKTRRLWPCILAHAVTNLALGIHVLMTSQWQWW